MQSYRATTRRHLSTSPFAARVPESLKTFEVDDRVSHDREGLGRVRSVESDGTVIVEFTGRKLVRIPAPFAKLHAL